jgi:hypothetical protein
MLHKLEPDFAPPLLQRIHGVVLSQPQVGLDNRQPISLIAKAEGR